MALPDLAGSHRPITRCGMTTHIVRENGPRVRSHTLRPCQSRRWTLQFTCRSMLKRRYLMAASAGPKSKHETLQCLLPHSLPICVFRASGVHVVLQTTYQPPQRSVDTLLPIFEYGMLYNPESPLRYFTCLAHLQYYTMVPGIPATSIFSATMQPKPSFASPNHISSQLQSTTTNPMLYPQTGGQIPDPGHVFGHTRAASNGVKSLQYRKKFPDEYPPNQMHPTSITSRVRQVQNAFEVLPQPCAPAAASASMSADEIEMLRKQAMGQAVRFGVLRSKDVDRLSRVCSSSVAL